MRLTYTQCKAVINEYGRTSLEEWLEVINNQPEWLLQLGKIECPYTICDVAAYGCSGGAYMPAVTYHEALECMNKYDDDMLNFLELQGYVATMGELDLLEAGSLGALAVNLCSAAVTEWCRYGMHIAEILTENSHE